MRNEDAKEAKEKALVPHTRNLPNIPDEKIDQIISLSDDQTIWIKVIEGGFKITSQDKFVKFLVGKIVDATPYLIKFEGGTPTKIPNVINDLEIPEGYERRCDVKLLVEDEVFGISLPPSSTKFYLSPYLKYLKNKNMRPESVLTRVISKQASNQFGTWPVAVFELAVDSPEAGSPKNYPKDWD
jgi:hypothetical protein